MKLFDLASAALLVMSCSYTQPWHISVQASSLYCFPLVYLLEFGAYLGTTGINH